MKISINAGHYPGLDRGAVGESGLEEAIVAKDISTLAANYLQKAGYDVLVIQENQLQDICNQSNAFSADLFVAIHCNAASNEFAKGTETFCFSEVSEGGKLARSIQNRIVSTIGTVDRGVKTGNGFYVLKHTDCPAVLVETAFISNKEDEALLASHDGKDAFARAIAVGLTNYVAGM